MINFLKATKTFRKVASLKQIRNDVRTNHLEIKPAESPDGVRAWEAWSLNRLTTEEAAKQNSKRGRRAPHLLFSSCCHVMSSNSIH